jgi:tripartite-type tricarboxylate transporter receptor subunit TctC
METPRSVCRRIGVRFLLAACCLGLASGAQGQTGPYPNRPIKFIVPLTPGGGNDVLARIIADRMTPAVGQPVVVENKPGAGGNIGTEYTTRQPADGYTILITTPTHVMNTNFYAKLSYDPIKDFSPVSLVAMIPFVLTVNAGFPAQNVKELIALAKAQPGKLTFGTAGIGTPHHMSVEMLRSMTGIELLHVPYKGAAGIVIALVANEISMTIGAINSLLPHIRSGKLRALAVAGSARTPLLPEVPTVAEAGGLPGYAMDSWFGVLAPAGTPAEIIGRLNTEINRAVRDPVVAKERLAAAGIEPVGTTPERFGEMLREELVKWGRVAKEAGIKPE